MSSQCECPKLADSVEKVRLLGAFGADSLLLVAGDSADDGRTAGDAGGAVYGFSLELHVPDDRLLGKIDRFAVPGLSVCDKRGAPDVMRGEETQILGALSASGRADGLFVLPGTHSKWTRVEAGRIVGFATFMTGEVFAALKDHSLLGRLMAP